jgi:hypothetical protein
MAAAGHGGADAQVARGRPAQREVRLGGVVVDGCGAAGCLRAAGLGRLNTGDEERRCGEGSHGDAV